MTPTRRWFSLFVAVTLVWIVALPASGDTIASRAFEEEIWDEPPSEYVTVGEELRLVDMRYFDLSRTRRSAGYAGMGLDITIPEGGLRGFGPFDRLGPFDDATKAPDQVWYRYHIRLTSWNAASSGKLPGLAGIYSDSGRGCIRSTTSSPGWSARGMFDEPGTHGAPEGEVPIGTYLYHVDQAGDCGDGLWWGASLEQGRWHCVQGMVKMNTPGWKNGVFRGWLDGKLVIGKDDIQYRRAGEKDVGVRHMWHNVYFGGDWPTPNQLSLSYDQVAVSTSGQVGCLRPFTDIGQTMHTKAITEMHALGYFQGCDYRKACPTRELTRGEAAALISRVLSLPSPKTDHFIDDTDSTFQNVINRLGDAGIAAGCNPPANNRFCPDRNMTRAEFAAMLTRALNLPRDTPDAFNDDDGHWAEEVINRFAAAGLTSGCGSGRFCPDRVIPRAEAIAFFYRSLDLLVPIDQASSQPPADWPPAGEPPPIPPEERD